MPISFPARALTFLFIIISPTECESVNFDLDFGIHAMVEFVEFGGQDGCAF